MDEKVYSVEEAQDLVKQELNRLIEGMQDAIASRTQRQEKEKCFQPGFIGGLKEMLKYAKNWQSLS